MADERRHGARASFERVASPAALAALHAAAFPIGGAWSEGALASAAAAPGALLLEARSAAQGLTGFALARVAADEAELLTIAIAPASRRQGAGSTLLEALIGRLAADGVASLLLEVAADNHAARGLYAQFRFREIGLRKGYYARSDGSRAHAIMMCKTIDLRE